jgi:hypothetical protein
VIVRKFIYTASIIAIISLSCSKENKPNVSIAGDFIAAFYSFNSDSLKSILASAPSSHPEILYYQKWAECAHYQILERGDFITRNDSTVICPITVKDDLMKTLRIDFNVTDTFHIVIKHGLIRSVRTSSNDPDDYYKAKEWVKQSRPQYIEKPCEGIWEGGPTPCECVQGMLKGFEEYSAGL